MLETQTRSLEYYEALIKSVKHTYEDKIDVVIVVATLNEFNLKYDFKQTNNAIYLPQRNEGIQRYLDTERVLFGRQNDMGR